MMTREQLAKSVLAMLDGQKTYFRLKPDDPGKRIALEASKKSEKELRRQCEGILQSLPLFGGDDGEQNGDD